MQKILFVASIVFFFLGISLTTAQESMAELERLRKKEEKNRKKTNKKENKAKYSSQSPSEDLLFHLNKKKQKQTRNKKYRKNNIPKASDRLSRENYQKNINRNRHRKGSDGLTKAVRGQRRAEKRRKRGVR